MRTPVTAIVFGIVAASSFGQTPTVTTEWNAKYKTRIQSFENEYGVSFNAAIDSELESYKKKNPNSPVNEVEMEKIYNAVFSHEYGKIFFTSAPKNGTIYVGSDEQNEKTNVTLGFRTGTHKCKIVTPKKTCEKEIIVEARKVSKMECK